MYICLFCLLLNAQTKSTRVVTSFVCFWFIFLNHAHDLMNVLINCAKFTNKKNPIIFLFLISLVILLNSAQIKRKKDYVTVLLVCLFVWFHHVIPVFSHNACSNLEFCFYKPCAFGYFFWLPESQVCGILPYRWHDAGMLTYCL